MTSESFLSLSQFLNDNFPEIVVTIVTEFLFADMPMHVAFKRNAVGSTELLEFLVERGIRDTRSSRWTVAKLFHTNAHYFRWEFNKLLTTTLRYGDVTAVHWVLDHFPDCRILPNVATEAVERGDLALLQRFEAERGVQWTSGDLGSADHLNVIRLLDDRVGTRDTRQANTRAVKSAIERNRVAEVKWLITWGFGVAYDANLDGDWGVRSQMVRFLLEKGFDKNRHYYVKCALQKAAAAGDLEFVKYVVANYTPENLETCGGLYNVEKSLRGAASHGHLPVVQWLLTYMKTLPVLDASKQAMVAAAKGGQLEVMRWLIEQFADDPSVKLFGRSGGDQSDSLVLDAAAEYEQLCALLYLHQVAVATTSLQTLHCLYRAVDHAAANGHLEVAKWLHKNIAAECSTNAMDAAATCAHLLAPWPESHNCSCGKPPKSVVARQIAMLQYLKDHFSRGCTTVAMDRAAARGNLSAAREH